MVLITIVTGAYKPTYNWGAHIVDVPPAELAKASELLKEWGPGGRFQALCLVNFHLVEP